MSTGIILSVLAHFTWIGMVVTAQMRVIVVLHIVIVPEDRAVIDYVAVLSEGTKLRRVLLDGA